MNWWFLHTVSALWIPPHGALALWSYALPTCSGSLPLNPPLTPKSEATFPPLHSSYAFPSPLLLKSLVYLDWTALWLEMGIIRGRRQGGSEGRQPLGAIPSCHFVFVALDLPVISKSSGLSTMGHHAFQGPVRVILRDRVPGHKRHSKNHFFDILLYFRTAKRTCTTDVKQDFSIEFRDKRSKWDPRLCQPLIKWLWTWHSISLESQFSYLKKKNKLMTANSQGC